MSVPFPNAAILVVDDEPGLVDLVSSDVEDLAGRILRAGTGREAIEILERKKVDLVLSDVRMPSGSGFDVLQCIHRLNDARENTLGSGRADLIFLSAFSDIAADEAFGLGCVGVFAKPWDPEALRNKVTMALKPLEERWLELDTSKGLPPGRIVEIPWPPAAHGEGLAQWGMGGVFVPGLGRDLEVYDEVTLLANGAVPLDTGGAREVWAWHGVVRWIRRFPSANLPTGAGIEITHVTRGATEAFLNFAKSLRPRSYIPRA